MSETKTKESLALFLRALKLPSFGRYHQEIAQKAEKEGWTFGQYLHHLAELEVEERKQRRIERNLKLSDLPLEKTLATLNRTRVPSKVQKQLPTLCHGAFVERGDNVLIFGLPGRGKTHLAAAMGHELVRRGHRVLFTATFALVQRLLAAKRASSSLSTPSTPSSSMTSATCSRAATRWRFSSPSSPSATSDVAW